jgi:hypothetical protein
MGFIQQSTTKKIYAYLTQYARQQILDGNESDFTVKYFSLHDNDVNYKISANIVNNVYNTLPSGFVPDITGDNDGCLFSIANGIQLENSLGEPPIDPPEPISPWVVYGNPWNISLNGKYYKTNETLLKFGNFIIEVAEGPLEFRTLYDWFVVSEVTSETLIPSIQQGSSITSPLYGFGLDGDGYSNSYQYFNATFSEPLKDGKLREVDAYNFKVYAKTKLTGDIILIKTFENINASERRVGCIFYDQEVVYSSASGNIKPILPNIPIYQYGKQPISITVSNPYGGLSGYKDKYNVAFFIIDRGNKRSELSITAEDIPNNQFDNNRKFINLFASSEVTLVGIPSGPPNQGNPPTSLGLYDGNQIFSNLILIDEQIAQQNYSPTNEIQWIDYAQSINESALGNVTSYANPLNYKGPYGLLHPTVIPLRDSNSNVIANKIYFAQAQLQLNSVSWINSGLGVTTASLTMFEANYENSLLQDTNTIIFKPYKEIGLAIDETSQVDFYYSF